MFFVKQFIILMKQIFIFGTDKTFTVIFFSVLHEVITYGFGIIIDESSANCILCKHLHKTAYVNNYIMSPSATFLQNVV